MLKRFPSERELNALRRLLNRYEVRAQDVAALGLPALQRAQGLGAKGLQRVLEWLRGEGYCLEPSARAEHGERRKAGKPENALSKLEKAQALLEQSGYRVIAPEHRNAGRTGDE